MRTVRLTPPRRRSRRTTPAPAGRRPDLRRTVREAMRTHGDPATLRWRERRLRPGRWSLVLDVSGSMADYSRALLQFAHVTSRASRRVEVFCFGTRLTRITRELEHRRPDEALDRAAGRSSTGRAAPGSATRSTRSSGTGAGAASAAAASW